MAFEIGDRVRISDTAKPAFIKQGEGNTGTIIAITLGSFTSWVRVEFDHSYQNNYPISALIKANEHQPMEELDISLDEIESYQEIYRKLEKERT